MPQRRIPPVLPAGRAESVLAALTMLGVLGEYLWRTLDEARRRPRYLVEADTAGPDAPPP